MHSPEWEVKLIWLKEEGQLIVKLILVLFILFPFWLPGTRAILFFHLEFMSNKTHLPPQTLKWLGAKQLNEEIICCYFGKDFEEFSGASSMFF